MDVDEFVLDDEWHKRRIMTGSKMSATGFAGFRNEDGAATDATGRSSINAMASDTGESRSAGDRLRGWLAQFRAPQALLPMAGLLLGIAGTVMALALIAGMLWREGTEPLLILADASPVFWLVFVAGLLVEPVIDYVILRRIVGLGRETLPPLVRKQSLNALLFGYAGDTYFMGWLQPRLGSASRAIGLGCDLAIASALVNSLATLGMLLLVWEPLQGALGARIEGWSAVGAGSLIAVPMALTAWRGLKRPGRELAMILAFQALRTVVATLMIAAMWHLALPAVPLLSWMMLLAARMAVSRLPIVPNKDLAFAALVPLFGHAHGAVGPMIAAVALLTLVAQAALAIPGPLLALRHRRRLATDNI